MIMSSSLRSLFVVGGFLFAGMTGCAAADDCAYETPEEHAAHTQDQNGDETAPPKVEEQNLAVQKKPISDLAARPESPKK
jgi:hypothetical protein